MFVQYAYYIQYGIQKLEKHSVLKIKYLEKYYMLSNNMFLGVFPSLVMLKGVTIQGNSDRDFNTVQK